MTDTDAPKPAKTETTPRRRRRKARLAIYDRLPTLPMHVGGESPSVDLADVDHVVVDLAGTSDPPEVFNSTDLAEARGFVAGAEWAGVAEAVD